MIVNLPKLGQVEFPDNLSAQQFDALVGRLEQKYDFRMPKPELGLGEIAKRGFMRSLGETGIALGDVIPAGISSAFVHGGGDYAKRQMEEAAQTQREIERTNPAQFASYKDVSGPGEATKFFLENLGEQVPNIATSLVPGGIGGTLARRGAVAAVETAAKEAGLSGAEALTGEAALAASKKIASKTGLGQNIGVALGSYAQNAPEVFQNIYEQTGKLEPGAALLYGSVSAALDSALPASIMSKITGPAKVGLVEKVLEKSGMQII
mgnify:CR=1 FL=1